LSFNDKIDRIEVLTANTSILKYATNITISHDNGTYTDTNYYLNSSSYIGISKQTNFNNITFTFDHEVYPDLVITQNQAAINAILSACLEGSNFAIVTNDEYIFNDIQFYANDQACQMNVKLKRSIIVNTFSINPTFDKIFSEIWHVDDVFHFSITNTNNTINLTYAEGSSGSPISLSSLSLTITPSNISYIIVAKFKSFTPIDAEVSINSTFFQ
jgi:hypothetical protein